MYFTKYIGKFGKIEDEVLAELMDMFATKERVREEVMASFDRTDKYYKNINYYFLSIQLMELAKKENSKLWRRIFRKFVEVPLVNELPHLSDFDSSIAALTMVSPNWLDPICEKKKEAENGCS